MKKILYIGGFELPDKNAAAQRVISNGKALRELGHEVVFIGLTKSAPESFQYQDFDCRELAYPESKKKWISFLFSIKKEAELIKSFNPDILVFYNYPSFKLWWLKNRFRNKTIFGDITEWYESSGLSLTSIVKRIDVWLRMRMILPKIDGLIVISEYLEDFYRRKVKNVINIPPLVDIYENKWAIIQNSTSENRYNLVYAGSPGGGNKDRLDLIVSSVRKARLESGKDIHLDVIGLNKKEFLENFGTNLETKIEDEYIHFHGRVSHMEALEFVKKADFSIFLRNNNLTNTAGFPTKFVESISCGTPVITNPSSNLSSYFKKYPDLGVLIDSLTEDSINLGIMVAISQSKEQIRLKKQFCLNCRLFDYRNYLVYFNELLKKENK